MGSVEDRWWHIDVEGIRVKTDRHGKGKQWRARYWRHGKQHSKAFIRKGDAERWLLGQLGDVERGDWIAPKAGRVRLDDHLEGWLVARNAKRPFKPKTLHLYRQLIDTRINPAFGDYMIRHLQTDEIATWLDTMTPARARQARALLHAALESAVRAKLIPTNPVTPIEVPTVRPRRQRPLTASELGRLAEAAEAIQEGAGLVILTLGYSGIRWGEMVALRGSDVTGRRLNIEQDAVDVGGRLETGAPKTWQVRSVVVPQFIADRLEDREGLVFTAPRGGPLRSSNWRRTVWKPALVAAGLPPDLVIHDLRDTAASLMVSSGASVLVVARQLGHANPNITLTTYASLFDHDLDALADRMGDTYGPGGVSPTSPENVIPLNNRRSEA